MYQNHAKAIKGLGIAIIVLAALTIAGCLLGLAFTVFSGSMAATFVPYSYNDASIAADMHEAGLSDDEAIALFTMVFGMIGAGLVWAALCSVFVLVAGIKALGAANDPAKLKGAMTWNIVGAVASFLGGGLVTTVLCIIVAVFASKDKAALEAGYFYAQPPAQPQPQPPYYPYQ